MNYKKSIMGSRARISIVVGSLCLSLLNLSQAAGKEREEGGILRSRPALPLREKELQKPCPSVASLSEDEEESSSLHKKGGFRRFFRKYGGWPQNTKPSARPAVFVPRESLTSSGYETDDQDEVGLPFKETSLNLKREETLEVTPTPRVSPSGVFSPVLEPETDSSLPELESARRFRERRKQVLSPHTFNVTLKALDRSDAERALKKVLERVSDGYEAKGASFTRDLKEFEEIVDQFIRAHPVLSSMTAAERVGFIKSNARSQSGTTPLKPMRHKVPE